MGEPAMENWYDEFIIGPPGDDPARGNCFSRSFVALLGAGLSPDRFDVDLLSFFHRSCGPLRPPERIRLGRDGSLSFVWGEVGREMQVTARNTHDEFRMRVESVSPYTVADAWRRLADHAPNINLPVGVRSKPTMILDRAGWNAFWAELDRPVPSEVPDDGIAALVRLAEGEPSGGIMFDAGRMNETLDGCDIRWSLDPDGTTSDGRTLSYRIYPGLRRQGCSLGRTPGDVPGGLLRTLYAGDGANGQAEG